MTHQQLVDRAHHYVLHSGIPIDMGSYNYTYRATFALKELSTIASEIPDVWGYISTLKSSVVLECKTSRADYRSGLKKLHRWYPKSGMGKYRLYFTPPGLLDPDELPERFGLLECHETMVKTIKQPEAFEEYNWQDEQVLMASALRRIKLRGLLDTVYEDLNTKYRVEKL